MTTFLVLALFALFVIGGCMLGSKAGNTIAGERTIRARQGEIERGYLNAQINEEALRRIRERG